METYYIYLIISLIISAIFALCALVFFLAVIVLAMVLGQEKIARDILKGLFKDKHHRVLRVYLRFLSRRRARDDPGPGEDCARFLRDLFKHKKK